MLQVGARKTSIVNDYRGFFMIVFNISVLIYYLLSLFSFSQNIH